MRSFLSAAGFSWLGDWEGGAHSLFKLGLVGRVVGPDGERGLEFDKGIGVAREGALDAVDLAAEDEAGGGELGLYDGAPLDGRVDVAAPGWSPAWRGLFGRGAPGLEGVAVVRPLPEPGF